MSQVARPEPKRIDDPRDYLSDPDALYEVVDGRVVELPEMGMLAYFVAVHLQQELNKFLMNHPLGTAALEAIFLIDSRRNLRRRPDVAFVSRERWPLDRDIPEEGDWDAVPDLAVEVVSPNDRNDELMRKIRDYFQYGVRLVWVVMPAVQQVYEYEAPARVRILGPDEELDGGAVLPGFRAPIAPLFRRRIA